MKKVNTNETVENINLGIREEFFDGAFFYTNGIYLGDRKIGYFSYDHFSYENDIFLGNLEIVDAERRKGYGTKVINHIFSKYPNTKIIGLQRKKKEVFSFLSSFNSKILDDPYDEDFFYFIISNNKDNSSDNEEGLYE